MFALATAALVTKHLLLFQVFALYVRHYGRLRAVGAMAGSLAVFGALLLPYAATGGLQGILRNVLHYQSLGGFYGLGLVLPHSLHMALFYLLMIFVCLTQPDLLTVTLAFLVFTPGLSDSYFVIPLLFCRKYTRLYWLYTACACTALLAPQLISGAWSWAITFYGLNATWIVCVLWLTQTIKIRFNTR